ncbi:hypothetical protein BaRGS_00017370, partial [Batillaria attramentaria]
MRRKNTHTQPLRVLVVCLAVCGTLTIGSANETSTVSLSSTPGTTEGNSAQTETGADETVAMSEIVQLMNHIQNVTMSKGKVPPLIYDTTGKPKVTVDITIMVSSVLGVDDVQQTVKTNGFLMMSWQDKSLGWNASDYPGVEFVEVPLDGIWTPQIFVGNSPQYQSLLDLEGNVIAVHSNGLIVARAIFNTNTVCDMDLTHYPFDTQTCILLFSSFSKLVAWKVNTNNVAKDLGEAYGVSTEWELLGTKAMLFHIEQYDEGGPMIFLTMKRKTTFYAVCLVLPMALTSYINTLVFLLPLDYFTSMMPRGLDIVPNTMKLLIGVILESLIVLLATIIVLRRSHNQVAKDKREWNGSSQTTCESRRKLSPDEVEEVTTSKLCCTKDPRVKTVRVAPAPGLQNWEGQEERKNRPSSKTDTRRPRPTAEQLDRVFFVLTFVGNTIFLATLLYQRVMRWFAYAVCSLLIIPILPIREWNGLEASSTKSATNVVQTTDNSHTDVTQSGTKSSERSALLRLMTHIRKLPVAREKVPPLENRDDGTSKVTVDATIMVGSVLNVDDVQQTVKTVGHLMLLWQDKSLAWNATAYGGIQSVEIPKEYIWTPPVGFVNDLEHRSLLDVSDFILIVRSDGMVYARNAFISETLCKMDLTHYPFDQQTCPLLFTSFSKLIHWTINQENYGTELAEHWAIGAEWELLAIESVDVDIKELDEKGLVVTIKMKRKTTFYTVCLVLPMALTSYMNTMVFLLPLQSGEKISFLVTIYVSASVFVSYFTSMMPRGLDSVPNTMKLLVGVIVESLVVLLCTIFVLWWYHRETTREPTCQKGEATLDLRSCKSTSRVHASQKLPAPEVEKEVDKPEDSQSPSNADATRPRPTAKQFDCVFFVLTFVGNTIFLAIALTQSASP